MLVENQIIIELKAVEQMHPVFEAQLLTYLKLSGKRLGFLINFNVPLIKNGIRRMVS
jgi:GxxExxY protein